MAKLPYRPVKFPRDEQAHDNIIEWWYFNGHLKDKRGGEYSFMECLFKTDPKKVNIPFFVKVPFRTHYFSHSSLTDHAGKKNSPTFSFLSLPSRDSFTRPLLFINYVNTASLGGYINCAIEERAKFEYRLKTERLDLVLSSKKGPLLVGGKGYLKLGSQSTYYYSLTDLKAGGLLLLDGQAIEVEGTAWMDHQWADEPYAGNAWDWFAIRLEGGTEILCFQHKDVEGNTCLASISNPDGRPEHFHGIGLEKSGNEWISPETNAAYPLSWTIRIPMKNATLEITPRLEEHEMVFGLINYWEGPIRVSGTYEGKKVSGTGFMELAGYPARIDNVERARKELTKTASDIFDFVKKELAGLKKSGR